MDCRKHDSHECIVAALQCVVNSRTMVRIRVKVMNDLTLLSYAIPHYDLTFPLQLDLLLTS
jgi:hypothetical protein